MVKMTFDEGLDKIPDMVDIGRCCVNKFIMQDLAVKKHVATKTKENRLQNSRVWAGPGGWHPLDEPMQGLFCLPVFRESSEKPIKLKL